MSSHVEHHPYTTCLHNLVWDCGIVGFVTTGTPMWPVCPALMVCAQTLSDLLAFQCGDGPWLPATTDTTSAVCSVACQ